MDDHTSDNKQMIVLVLEDGLYCRVEITGVGTPPGLLFAPENRDFGALRVTYEVLAQDPDNQGLREEILGIVDDFLIDGRPVLFFLGADGVLQYEPDLI